MYTATRTRCCIPKRAVSLIFPGLFKFIGTLLSAKCYFGVGTLRIHPRGYVMEMDDTSRFAVGSPASVTQEQILHHLALKPDSESQTEKKHHTTALRA